LFCLLHLDKSKRKKVLRRAQCRLEIIIADTNVSFHLVNL
jgi:hypothetical protein